jgi:hypothetical protein
MLVTIKRFTCGYWKSLCLKKLDQNIRNKGLKGEEFVKKTGNKETMKMVRE